MSESLLTARQIADHLGVSAATVLDRWERGDLPGYRLWGAKGGPVRFRLSEIEETLERWHMNGSGAGGEVSPTPTADPTRPVFSQASPTPHRGGTDAK